MAFKILNRSNNEPTEIKEEVMREEPKQVKAKELYMVVAKLPTQEIRKYKNEDGDIVNLITIEEYLTERANAGN